MKCPNCKGDLTIDPTLKQYKCDYCGSVIQVDEEIHKTRIEDAEKTGYQFEKGRMKAQSEAGINEVPIEKKKITIWRVLLWVVFLPIMLLYVIWTNKKLSQKMKIILSVIVVAFTLLFASKNKIEQAIENMTMKKEIIIPAKEVYFADWLDDCFETMNKDAHIQLSKDRTEATITLPLRCKKTPMRYVEEQFKEHNEEYETYELIDRYFELNDVYLHENSYNAEGLRNGKKIKEILNLEEGEHDLEIIVPLNDGKVSEFMKQTQLYLQMKLNYKNAQEDYIYIPWYKSEHKEPTPTPEPVIEETPVPTLEITPDPTIEPTPEETTEAKATVNGVTPEFKEQMDSIEAFYDKYIDFMKSYDGSSLDMTLKYAELMKQYYDTTQKLEEMDTSSMTPADEAYYIEVYTRINQKLMQAAIDMN